MPTLILAKRPSSFVFDGTSGLFLPFDIVIDFTNTLFDHAKRLSIKSTYNRDFLHVSTRLSLIGSIAIRTKQ